MSLKVRLYILGFYDLLLAIGSVYMVRELITIEHGSITEAPMKWLLNPAFADRIPLGITVLLLFGIGNMAASICCYIKQRHLSWILSAAVASFLYVLLVLQVLLTGVWQLSTGLFFAFSILQMFFCRMVYMGQKRREKRYIGLRGYS